jgi:hypothetical protein
LRLSWNASASDKAAAILGVDGRVSSAKAGAETIDVAKVGVEVGIEVSAEVGMEVGAEVGIEVSAEVKMEVSAEIGMATTEEIRKTGTGSIIRGFKGLK